MDNLIVTKLINIFCVIVFNGIQISVLAGVFLIIFLKPSHFRLKIRLSFFNYTAYFYCYFRKVESYRRIFQKFVNIILYFFDRAVNIFHNGDKSRNSYDFVGREYNYSGFISDLRLKSSLVLNGSYFVLWITD